jgi:beta-lactamase class A
MQRLLYTDCRIARMRMRRLFLQVLLCAFSVSLLTLPGAAQQGASAGKINNRIQGRIQSLQESVSLYAKNLATGASYGFHADEAVPTASTIKLPIMAELFFEASEGRLDWNQKLTLRDADKVSGTGVIRELADGDELTIRDLMHLMIVVSDNTATNLILHKIGGNAVNSRMEKLGLQKTAVMHNIMESKVVPGASGSGGPTGVTLEGAKPGNAKWDTGRSCPRDMVTILEKLYRGQLVDKEASNEMISVLKRQQYHEGAGRKMNGTVIASKSGALDHLRSDVAIIYSKQGPIAMAITVKDIPEVNYRVDNPGNILISDLSEILVEELGSPAGASSSK